MVSLESIPNVEVVTEETSSSGWGWWIVGGISLIFIFMTFFDPPDHRPKPVQERKKLEKLRLTREQLKAYNDTDKSLPILMGVCGVIFDVTRGAKFYGQGGSYSLFAGRDATRSLALSSFEKADLDNPSIVDLDDDHLSAVQDWFQSYVAKYDRVGILVDENDQPLKYPTKHDLTNNPNTSQPQEPKEEGTEPETHQPPEPHKTPESETHQASEPHKTPESETHQPSEPHKTPESETHQPSEPHKTPESETQQSAEPHKTPEPDTNQSPAPEAGEQE